MESSASAATARKTKKTSRRCCLGQHFIADPDGVLVDIAGEDRARRARSVERARRRFVDRIEWPGAELEQIYEHLARGL